MTTYAIPLVATPSQTLTVQLGAQPCRIDVRQRRTGLFVDLYVQDVPVRLGVKAMDRTKLVRDKYMDFVGDLYFTDLQGDADPDYTGLGGRFLFVWDEAA